MTQGELFPVEYKVRVVNIRTEWQVPYIYVGRPTVWGNPWKAGEDGTREEVIARYRAWIETRQDLLRWLRRDMERLGVDALGCWCAPKPCHADVLAELL